MASPRTHADHDRDREDEQQRQPGVGALLRASRLRCGEELRDIAELLCIRYLYLEAIEAGRYHELPGTTYAIGFIRAYAEHLGLDAEEVVRRFKAEQSSLKRHDELAFPTPVPESGIPKGAIVFVGLLVAGLAYGAWYVSSSEEGGFADLIGPLPERLEALIEGTGGASSAADTTSSETSDDVMTANDASMPTGGAAAGEPSAGFSENERPVLTESGRPDMTAGRPAATASSSPAVAPSADSASEPAESIDAAQQEASRPETPAAAAETTSASDNSSAPASEPAAEAPPAPTEAGPVVETAESTPTPTPAREAEETAPAMADAEEAVVAEPAPPAAPAPDAAPVVAEDAPTGPAAPEARENSVAAAPPPAPAAPQADTRQPEAAPETAAATPAAGAGGDIRIRAVDNSWVQIRDTDANETVVTRLLRAGEEITVPARPSLMLSTGNAGGLEIVVDGNVVPSLGGAGTVRRNVPLDAERLRAGTAVQ